MSILYLLLAFILSQGLSCCEHFAFYIVKIISEITAETVVIIVKRIVNVKYCRVRIHYRHNISSRTEKKLVVIYHSYVIVPAYFFDFLRSRKKNIRDFSIYNMVLVYLCQMRYFKRFIGIFHIKFIVISGDFLHRSTFACGKRHKSDKVNVFVRLKKTKLVINI